MAHERVGQRGIDDLIDRLQRHMKASAICIAVWIGSINAPVADALGLAQAPHQIDVPPMTYSRALPASDLVIWQGEGSASDAASGDGFDSALVCTADSSKGDCPTTASVRAASGPFEDQVKLTFTEETSRQSIVLTAVGHKRLTDALMGESHYMRLSDPTGTVSSILDLPVPGNASYALKIPQSELARIPFGGVWTARLEMYLTISGSSVGRYEWAANITLRALDDGQIVLLGEAANLSKISLNLTRNGASLQAEKSVEACLSDGFSGHSAGYTLTLSDPGSRDGRFHIRHADVDRIHEIDYEVSVGGRHTPVTSGVIQVLSDIDRKNLRPQRDPVNGNPLYCAPLTIHLAIPPFDPQTKRVGDYEGTLRIEYTPTVD